jgi:hypothetical protein
MRVLFWELYGTSGRFEGTVQINQSIIHVHAYGPYAWEGNLEMAV